MNNDNKIKNLKDDLDFKQSMIRVHNDIINGIEKDIFLISEEIKELCGHENTTFSFEFNYHNNYEYKNVKCLNCGKVWSEY